MAETLSYTEEEDEDVLGMPKVVRFLSSLLHRVAESNDAVSEPFRKASAFHGLTRPTISIQSYLERMFKYAHCSPSCFVVAYVYLDRFVQMQPSAALDSFSVHRLLITSVLVSAKFMDDLFYNNAYYAKVGGISTKEMNILELDFLFGMSFQLNVTPATFYTYCSYLQREMLVSSPPPHLGNSSLKVDRSLMKLHCCFNEDECTHQEQLAV